MGLLDAIAQHLGLTALTAIAVVLTIYLIYSMVHPERFQK
jgi:K+-transporting ATPase KdpF subunit